MPSDTTANYLYDLGHLIKEEAEEAAARRDAASENERSFLAGVALGYINVLNLMLDQAKAFGLDPSALHLAGFNPDQLH
jgi:hypothetical protein